MSGIIISLHAIGQGEGGRGKRGEKERKRERQAETCNLFGVFGARMEPILSKYSNLELQP